MKCPVDNEVLVIAERSGVEIDYCPKCRGVWLDRGELDKILDRAATVVPTAQIPPSASRRPEHFRDEDGGRDHDDDERRYRRSKPFRRESFLSELFDF